MVCLGTASSLVALAAAFLLIYCAASTSKTLASAAGTMTEVRASPSCDRALGQCAAGSDEEDEVVVARRSMTARQPRDRYISYAALRADQVPCNQRGRSYYSNCGASQQPANPYRRGCSAITRCARNTKEE
ncbi:hypothetical protein SEVIR_3G074400v4 [Setaria viridis]|uniref:Rapid alkalinization factor 1 n=1 Tax=Setaria viridis TaxID=4556 RepID=A0A4U6V6G7_SETVI|nr:rapid alkalinization factor-like [Setaria viridis]TKW24810.1 hypothetical protein SEVIR_3G074400v2 [Setaria viridis]